MAQSKQVLARKMELRKNSRDQKPSQKAREMIEFRSKTKKPGEFYHCVDSRHELE